jgi:2-polyprenyl-3-methyl-5-hydroxy-6-metoxy-1,4-benzoquinol methylase
MTTSMRDPGGHVCLVGDRVIRIVNEVGLSDLQAFLNSGSSAQFFQSHKLVNTRFLDPEATARVLEYDEVRCVYEQSHGTAVVEHDRVPFPSFPYEWPAEMLHAAAALTLDFAEQLINDGLGLKDASPYNVLFHGSQAMFVDLLSFERRDAGDPTWLPLAQFVRTFLLPLLVNKHFGISLAELFTAHRDGLEPEEVFRLLGPVQKFRAPFRSLVSLPVWLASTRAAANTKLYQKKHLSNQPRAQFTMRSILRNMRRKLAASAPRAGRTSVWTDYMDRNNYSQDYFPLKSAFVSEVMRTRKPQAVLDVGCNTGHFSTIAARNGSRVVAIDYDPVVVGELWRQASAQGLDILPLVVNLARPTPGIGWRNAECASFLDRARGKFDAVLMLGVIHHLLVSERIPLVKIIELAADLTTDTLVIEFVAPDDRMFRHITRGRDHLFTGLTKQLFEETSRRHFDIVRCERLDETSRWLYLMRKKEALIECFEMQQ